MVGLDLFRAKISVTASRLLLSVLWPARWSHRDRMAETKKDCTVSVPLTHWADLMSLSRYDAGHRTDGAAPNGPP